MNVDDIDLWERIIADLNGSCASLEQALIEQNGAQCWTLDLSQEDKFKRRGYEYKIVDYAAPLIGVDN